MTNEKDGEEAKELALILRNNCLSSICGPCSSAIESVAVKLDRIRSEAYKEGFLDGCSKDGTQTERDKAMVEEAVKAERERLDDTIHALRILLNAFKRRRSGFPLDHENEIATEEFAERILSPDQGTDEKEEVRE